MLGQLQKQLIEINLSMKERASVGDRRELVKAFLFLRTATIAVDSLTAMMKSTQSYIAHAELRPDYVRHIELRETLAQEISDLEIWTVRLLEAQIGLVDWAGKCSLGFALPAEIIRLVRAQFASWD